MQEEVVKEGKIVWIPRTKTGKMVLQGEITTLEQIHEKNFSLLEPEIVDYLVPDLQEETLDIKSVQRTTDAGRKMSFLVTVVVGNKDGYVGVGLGKSLNVQPAIQRAVRNAKLNVIRARRGCGSWECNCGTSHSLPFKVEGRSGSVRVILIPAPKGTGLVVGDKAKRVLELAGIKDAWSRTKGDCRSTFNFALATLNALKNTRRMKLPEKIIGEEI